MYNATKDGPLQRVIKRFAAAVNDKAFQGTIPAGESEAAAAAYDAVDKELAAATKALNDVITKRVVRGDRSPPGKGTTYAKAMSEQRTVTWSEPG